MKDDRRKFEEFAELAARRREQVYSIPIPAARIADLEFVATARGEALRSLLRKWVLERLDHEARTGKGRYGMDQSTRILVESPHR